MDKKIKSNVFFSLKFLIPILILIGLLLSGISAGIITFEKPLEKITGKITAELKIDFNDGKNFSQSITIENSTVLSLLLEAEKFEDIAIDANYYEQYQSYLVDSITYMGKTYKSGDQGHWWIFKVNNEFAIESADKIYVSDNDLIEWKFEGF
jgi:hypothetical protein